MNNAGEILRPDSDGQIVLHSHGTDTQLCASMENVAIFPGSFNPLHRGHLKLRATAARLLEQTVLFELSITNVAKPDLSVPELQNRLTQFSDSSIAVTQAARFIDKAKLFPGCCFVVGYDTAERILSPAFYENSDASLVAALERMRECGSRFLVGGRLNEAQKGNQFQQLENLNVPTEFENMFDCIPEREFREDISSTQIRNNIEC